MPTNPRYQIISIETDSGTPMQSAARVPILVTFICQKYVGPDKYFEEINDSHAREGEELLRLEEVQLMAKFDIS